MQSTRGDVWQRLAADLGSLAKNDHREATANMFALSVEHMHPASPSCWPRRLTHLYTDDARELIALDQAIGAQARASYVRNSRKFGMLALAKLYNVPLELMGAVLERV